MFKVGIKVTLSDFLLLSSAFWLMALLYISKLTNRQISKLTFGLWAIALILKWP